MALGIHGISWILPGVVLGARIIAHRRTRFPLSSVPLVILVCWIPLSLTMIPPSGLPLFTYRWLLWVGCLTTFVWVLNVDESMVPSQRLVDWLAALWITLVAFGYLATLLPELAAPSPSAIWSAP